MTEPLDRDLVFERVQRCLDAVVGGSGHLTSYRLDRESFVCSHSRRLENGTIEYEFTVDGVRLSEFDDGSAGESGDAPVDETTVTERLEGTIVLDAEGALVTDETGRVRIRPWRTLAHGDASADDNGIDALFDELDSGN